MVINEDTKGKKIVTAIQIIIVIFLMFLIVLVAIIGKIQKNVEEQIKLEITQTPQLDYETEHWWGTWYLLWPGMDTEKSYIVECTPDTHGRAACIGSGWLIFLVFDENKMRANVIAARGLDAWHGIMGIGQYYEGEGELINGTLALELGDEMEVDRSVWWVETIDY